MSLYNALGDPHQQGNQGWSYTGGFNQTSGAFTNSTSSGRDQSSGSTIQEQSHILSSLLSAPSSGDRYVQLQLQETQTPQKEEDSMLLDEPGMVIGGEEVILTDNSSMTAGRYQPSVNQSQQALTYSPYVPKTGHAQFHQGSSHMSVQQEFGGTQQDLVNSSHSSQPVVSYGQDSYSSGYQMQRMQLPFMQQQGMGQQPHGLLQQQNHGQQGGLGQQTLSLPQHLQGQSQSHGPLQAVAQPQAIKQHVVGQSQLQQPIAGHQLYLGGQMNSGHIQSMGTSQQSMGMHHQQADVNHSQLNHQTVGQQHSVGQHLLNQQQVANHQSLVGQQSSIQVNQGVQNAMHGHLRFMNMHGDTPSTSNSMAGHNVQFFGGNNTVFIQQNQPAQQSHQAVLIQHLPQNMILPQTQQPQQNQFFQGQSFHNHQTVLRNSHNTLSIPNHQSLLASQTLQTDRLSIQSKPPPHIEMGNKQPHYDTNAGYASQFQGQITSSQQQQVSVKQEQQTVGEQGLLLQVVRPNSAVSGNNFVSSHHNTQQLLQQSPQNVIKVSMGSPLTQHSLSNSPQVTPHMSSLNSSQQIGVQQNSAQLSLQNSPQLFLKSSPQQFSVQGSPNVLQSSTPILRLHAPHLVQGKLQLSLQNVGHMATHPQNSHQVLQVQNSNQMQNQMQVQNTNQMQVQNTNQMQVQNTNQMQNQMQVQNANQMQNQMQVQNTSQMQVQNANQMQNQMQVQNANQMQVQNANQMQVQNPNQMLHNQNNPQTVQLAGNGSSQRSFQVSQQAEVNQKGANHLVGANTDPTVTSTGRGRGRARGRGNRGGRGSRGRGNNANSATGLHLAPSHFRVTDPTTYTPPAMDSSSAAPGVEQQPSVSCAENTIMQLSQDQAVQELAMPTPKTEAGSGSSPLQGTLLLSSLNTYSPPPSSVSSSVPRLSATNEVWPTPMPWWADGQYLDKQSIKLEQSADSPPALVVEPLSSSSQQSSDCPVFSPSSYLEDIKPSPPVAVVLPTVSAVSAPEVVAPPAPVQPVVKPVVPQLPEEQKPETTLPKRRLAEDEEGTAVCKYCGYCSSNFEVCEGCKRKLPPDVKVVVKKRKLDSGEQGDERERTCGGGKVNSMPSSNSSSSSMNKKTLYSSKLQAQGTAFPNAHHTDVLVGKTAGQAITFTSRRGRGSGRGGYRSKKPKEPVLVTISSDEDEDPSGDASQRLNASSANHTSQDENDDGFFCTPVTKLNSFGTSRRNKMQDASGQCISQQEAAEGIFFKVRGVRIGGMRTSGTQVCFKTRTILFKVKNLSDETGDTTAQELEFFVYVTELMWIKYSFSPAQPVFFLKVTPECGYRLRSQLKMTSATTEWFDPSSQEAQTGLIVVIVDSMLNEAGLRQVLQLYSQVQNISNFLQEMNNDMANDLLVQSTPPVIAYPPGETGLRASYQKITKTTVVGQSLMAVSDKGDTGTTGGEGLGETVNGPVSMSGDVSSEANETFNSSRDSRSPSPRTGFVGPIEKLLSYPPPPAKGAITITNEDLFCLNEGEFLNDVILDFYLKYLFLEKLSEEDRKRTHIFSSFFFKRLTQRQGKSTQDETEDKMTAQQRRHSRVKTWTRHVDIFSKDFLLIPINEKSHWFLAVVCFPGMVAQEHINYQPAASPYDEIGQSGDVASTPPQPPKTQSELAADDSSSQDSLPDTTTPSTSSKGDHVLGKVISVETAKKEKTLYNVGLRQACILIMDSLMGPSRNNIIRVLKDYLQVEWNLKRGTERNMLKTVRGGCPKVPQQTNYSDCGVFVLQYAESFFENPIASFSIPMKLEKWFPLSKVERKREEIRSLILRLQSEASR